MGYHSRRNKVSIRVEISYMLYGVKESFTDCIKGSSIGRALKRARNNWKDANIRYLGTVN